MICFKCEKEMSKTIFEGIVVDYCSECKSFWMDKGEFESAVAGKKFDVEECHIEADSEIEHDLVSSHGKGLCPKCEMGKMKREYKFSIEIDRCDSCEGVFFDSNELQRCFEKATEGFVMKLWGHVKDLF